jgi:hypothetical protein
MLKAPSLMLQVVGRSSIGESSQETEEHGVRDMHDGSDALQDGLDK